MIGLPRLWSPAQHWISQSPLHHLRVADLDLDARLQPDEISPPLRAVTGCREPSPRVREDVLDGSSADSELDASAVDEPLALTGPDQERVRVSVCHREPD